MSERQKHAAWAVAGYGALLLALLPVLWPAPFRAHPPGLLRLACALLALAVPAAAFGWCATRLSLGPSRRDHLSTLVLLVLLTAVMNDLHRTMVDESRTYFAPAYYPTSTAWQLRLHERALALDPSGLPGMSTTIPHVYRVLPDAFMRWIEAGTGSFTFARNVHRYTFMFLLLVTVHVWARHRFRHETALLGVALLAAVWPVTIRLYGGQPADPMSHLSFALSMVLIDRGRWLALCLVLSAGVLAKESVAVMAVYYALFSPRGPGHVSRAAAVLAAAGLPALAIRLWVTSKVGEGFDYTKVSGVGLSHVLNNLKDPDSYTQVAFSLGPFLAFFALAWPRVPRDLRLLVGFLLLTILPSNLLFSWLQEARNNVPIMAPLAMIAAAYLLDDPGLSPDARPRAPEGDAGQASPAAPARPAT